MRKISLKALKEAPLRVKVLYSMAFIFTMIGLVTMIIDVLDIYHIKLCVSLAFITCGSLINNVLLNKNKDQLFK